MIAWEGDVAITLQELPVSSDEFARMNIRRESLSPLARRLYDACEAKGLTWQDASKYCGVSKNTVRRIIQMETPRPDPDTLNKIADFFGWPVLDTMEWAGYFPRGLNWETTDPLQRIEHATLDAGLSVGRRFLVRWAFEKVMDEQRREDNLTAGGRSDLP